MKQFFARIIVLCVAAAALVSSCKCGGHEPEDVQCKNLLLVYTAGENSLSSYLDSNIEDIINAAEDTANVGYNGYVPSKNSEDVLLVMSHRMRASGTYGTNTPAHLLRLYSMTGRKTKKVTVVVDTLKTYSTDVIPTQKGSMRQILQDVDDLFHAEHYGMIFSSHGTGWVPPGYYTNPSGYDASSLPGRPRLQSATDGVPFVEDDEFPDGPAVRSLGQSRVRENGKTTSYEFAIDDFADEFPYHFDYIYFDACLMGGVEFAY